MQVATVCTGAQRARVRVGVCACGKAHRGASGALWARSGAGVVWDTGEGVNALTGACRGLCVGLGVWDAVQRDSVGGCMGIWGACGRAQGRVVWSGAGLGTLGAVWGCVGLDRGAGSVTGRTVCAAGQ